MPEVPRHLAILGFNWTVSQRLLLVALQEFNAVAALPPGQAASLWTQNIPGPTRSHKHALPKYSYPESQTRSRGLARPGQPEPPASAPASPLGGSEPELLLQGANLKS